MVGQDFAETAGRIIADTEAMVERIQVLSRGERGRLNIGVHTSLSAGNLRATLIDYHGQYPWVDMTLVDGSSDYLVADLAKSSLDVAFVIDRKLRWNGKALRVWSERVVAAVPQMHRFAESQIIDWGQLRGESILVPQRGPGADFLYLLLSKVGDPDLYEVQRHDSALDRLLTLVGAGLGILLVLEGATGASYPGVVFREVHDRDGPTRLSFSALWREENDNPALRSFLGIIGQRYPDFGGGSPPA